MKLLAAAPERCLPLPNYIRVIPNATSRRRLAITPYVTTDSIWLFPARPKERGAPPRNKLLLAVESFTIEPGQHQRFGKHRMPEVSDVQ